MQMLAYQLEILMGVAFPQSEVPSMNVPSINDAIDDSYPKPACLKPAGPIDDGPNPQGLFVPAQLEKDLASH